MLTEEHQLRRTWRGNRWPSGDDSDGKKVMGGVKEVGAIAGFIEGVGEGSPAV